MPRGRSAATLPADIKENAMARAPIAILAGLLAFAAGPVCASEIVYACSFAEVLTSAEGKILSREVSETVKVDDGLLQAWSDEEARWLPNQCPGATCTLTAEGFHFETVETTRTDAYTSVVTARLTIAAKTGKFDAETRFATTLAGTSDLTEANTHNAGVCHPAPDPAGP
jgi:hypothetical protein